MHDDKLQQLQIRRIFTLSLLGGGRGAFIYYVDTEGWHGGQVPSARLCIVVIVISINSIKLPPTLIGKWQNRYRLPFCSVCQCTAVTRPGYSAMRWSLKMIKLLYSYVIHVPQT